MKHKYIIEYRQKGYQIADAFRDNPLWGRQIKEVDANTLPNHSDLDVINAANHYAPPDHVLTVLTSKSEIGTRILFEDPIVNEVKIKMQENGIPKKHVEFFKKQKRRGPFI